MKLLALFCTVACAAGLTLAPAIPASPRVDHCFVPGAMNAPGGCVTPATGCANCCRHYDKPMVIPLCMVTAPGKQDCIPTQYPYKADVSFCPGTPANECTYAGEVLCGDTAWGSVPGGVACN